jgi:cobalamin biosynthesis protein CobC
MLSQPPPQRPTGRRPPPMWCRAAALAGHRAEEVSDLACVRAASLAVVVNPNNPDGRILTRETLLDCAHSLQRDGGILVVDEAFMEVGPRGVSLAGDVGERNIVVLRSFGKFFGLAGLRLGFALASPAVAARLRAALGPWAVSGPALAVGAKALADTGWIERTRRRLARAARRLDAILERAGLEVIGGTSLFRLAQTPAADALFRHLGRAGIFVRPFPDNASWLRFGLPANEPAWRRLEAALTSFAKDSFAKDSFAKDSFAK